MTSSARAGIMPPLELGSPGILLYNAEYRVLICRECEYAIQKSALASHLLRHKIYRADRQHLLSSVAHYEVLEPEDVLLPAPEYPPIPGLPILDGLRCTVRGCDYLCASEKRMRRHMSGSHGERNDENGGTSLREVRDVKMQTFFRGTKIRYFEINTSAAAGMARPTPLGPAVNPHRGKDALNKESHSDRVLQSSTATPPQPLSTSPLPMPKFSQVSPNNSLEMAIDLKTLTYFHYFTMTTSLTLLIPSRSLPARHYWQTDVVYLALRRQWLMCGLLALSAYHLAVLTEKKASKRGHCERARWLSKEFDIGWNNMQRSGMDGQVATRGEEEEVHRAGGRLICLMRLAQWTLHDETPDLVDMPSLAPHSPPQFFITAIQELVVPDVDRTVIEERHVRDDQSTANERPLKPALAAFLRRLRTLLTRMTDAFGPPNPSFIQDALSAFSSGTVLIRTCESVLASESLEGEWNATASWWIETSNYFHDMVLQKKPAALVVLVNWLMMIKQVEESSTWFVRRPVEDILKEIREQLCVESEAVRLLVEDSGA